VLLQKSSTSSDEVLIVGLSWFTQRTGNEEAETDKVVHNALVIQNRCGSRSEKSLRRYAEGVNAKARIPKNEQQEH